MASRWNGRDAMELERLRQLLIARAAPERSALQGATEDLQSYLKWRFPAGFALAYERYSPFRFPLIDIQPLPAGGLGYDRAASSANSLSVAAAINSNSTLANAGVATGKGVAEPIADYHIDWIHQDWANPL